MFSSSAQSRESKRSRYESKDYSHQALQGDPHWPKGEHLAINTQLNVSKYHQRPIILGNGDTTGLTIIGNRYSKGQQGEASNERDTNHEFPIIYSGLGHLSFQTNIRIPVILGDTKITGSLTVDDIKNSNGDKLEYVRHLSYDSTQMRMYNSSGDFILDAGSSIEVTFFIDVAGGARLTNYVGTYIWTSKNGIVDDTEAVNVELKIANTPFDVTYMLGIGGINVGDTLQIPVQGSEGYPLQRYNTLTKVNSFYTADMLDDSGTLIITL